MRPEFEHKLRESGEKRKKQNIHVIRGIHVKKV
jgi:hypothetical protein